MQTVSNEFSMNIKLLKMKSLFSQEKVKKHIIKTTFPITRTIFRRFGKV